MVHGHTVVPPGEADALLLQARQMDVDVLLWGGTHRFEAYELEGRFFINPGSATGAWSGGWWADGETPLPSFVLMDVSKSLRFVAWPYRSRLTVCRYRERLLFCTFTN